MVEMCASCPFRVSNHGKRVPKGWYSRANLERLWRGVSEGERLVCTERKEGEVRECAGALYLVARHLEAEKGPTYRRDAAIPLSPAGLARWRDRLVPHTEPGATTLAPSTPPTIGVPWRCQVTNTDCTGRARDEDAAG